MDGDVTSEAGSTRGNGLVVRDLRLSLRTAAGDARILAGIDLDLAPGELNNLAGYKPMNEGATSTLGEYPAYQLGGTWDSDGQTKIVAQKTVVIPGADGLYVLLAHGKNIVRQSDGSYAVDDKSYLVTIPSGATQPVLRGQSGRAELLLPVRFDRGEAAVDYSIVW